ncbi:MAG TPA: GNAT family N-acetyltransferase [Anaerovoracaceae bacterium]|nr:GNAT family N-acetyltransferase [Anaerovoracaceae bacterium]
MMRLIMKKTDDYEGLVDFFIANDLEFNEDDKVDTDIVGCWKIVHGEEEHLVGAIVLGKRLGAFIVDGIAVDPIYRKMDVGTILLNKAIEEAKKMGATELNLVARAPEFFRKKGFKTVTFEEAPYFFDCETCPQRGTKCHPEVMKLQL